MGSEKRCHGEIFGDRVVVIVFGNKKEIKNRERIKNGERKKIPKTNFKKKIKKKE